MDTNALKRFAQAARNLLIDQVGTRLAVVIDQASAARRENPDAMKKLDAAIARTSQAQVIEQVAYTWFNRFTALRFMDVNGYTNPRVVSPEGDATRPEILSEALAGNLPEGAPDTITALLDGRATSANPQAEAYRLLLVHACNHWHAPMPFMFEKVGDYTELLMPDDLLSPDSILARLREVMTPDACQDVEIIGWLYQFYISEKKDEVFAGLKKNRKITPEDIPAATQLFTPHWIVRYLVENSLGRLWLLNRPGSRLAERMDYYIAPEEPETDFLHITRPEDIRICDPACGSGHMLTYAFDLLHAIYEEEGYEPATIPALILTHNLTGIEIDDRAGALAAFALAMKAAERLGRRRFLRMEARPDITVLQNIRFDAAEMQDIAAMVGRDLFTDELRETLGQFEQAKNFGSLIVPKLRDPVETLRVVEARDFGADLLLREVQERVVTLLRMAEALAPKYHVVVANPPYMGGRGMNPVLADYLKANYADVRSDLFSAFIVRNTMLALPKGQLGFMTPFVWMFISSYEKLRLFLLDHKTITSLIQLEYSGFDGATVPICTFTLENAHRPAFKGGYIRLSDFRGAQNQGPKTLAAIRNPDCGWFHRAAAEDFEKIPGSPIAYWLSKRFVESFAVNHKLSDYCPGSFGMSTGDPSIIHQWHEVSLGRILFGALNSTLFNTTTPFAPYDKGGEFRRWYGNKNHVINWKNDGAQTRSNRRAAVRNAKKFCQPHLSWTLVTSGLFSSRRFEEGYLLDTASNAIYDTDAISPALVLGILNSKYMKEIAPVINPTLNFSCGVIDNVPVASVSSGEQAKLIDNVGTLQSLSRTDWDAYETSWDFTTLPLLAPEHRGETLAETYTTLRAHWQGMTDEMRRLEEENNRIFIDAYGLQDELTPEVPLEEITLTCNPAYRYRGNLTDEEREKRLLADTMAEFLHYAVGCMFGRYSLDAPGLILANQGEGVADYLARVPDPSFPADQNNVIPVLDADWFADDIVTRAREFLRVTFGEAKLRENLAFIESALGKDLRRWFQRDFYDDHVKRYKKRPIYWQFASPRGTFQALIYMHRYRPDTVSILLNDYLREFIRKLEGEHGRLEALADDPEATQGQRTKALRDVEGVKKQIAELEEWERDVVFPLAQTKVEIDLDDGVKQNYPKFGAALKRIKGLEAADA